jgi:hypothetical protein
MVSECDLRGALKIYLGMTINSGINVFISSLLETYCTRGLMIEYETGKPVHAIEGIKLRDVVIENKYETYNEEETFVNMCCDYSPGRESIFKNILDNYIEWKRINRLVYDKEKDDILLKEYLDSRNKYITAGHVGKQVFNMGYGYYGLGLVSERPMTRVRRHHEIEKCDFYGNILMTYCDKFDAAVNEEMPTTLQEISNFIRHRTRIEGRGGEYFYRKKVYHI